MLCSSPAEVAKQADAIFTIVGYPKDVEEVILGENGVLQGLKLRKSPAVVVDMTTSKPDLAARIAEAVSKVPGCAALDAPVSGGEIGAKEGRLAIMVGGDQSAFERVKPLLLQMGKPEKGGKVERTGAPGSGQQTKLTNQIIISTTMIGVVEGLLYAQKAGLDIETTLRLVGSGAAGSFSLSNIAPKMVARDFQPGFFVEHFVKDMEIALDECRRMELALPGLALAHQLYLALKAQGGAKLGTAGLLLAVEALNGIKK